MESSHATPRITDVIELRLRSLCLNILSRLNNPPDGPHSVRGRAPETNLLIQVLQLKLVISSVQYRIFSRYSGVAKIGSIEVASLLKGWIARRIK